VRHALDLDERVANSLADVTDHPSATVQDGAVEVAVLEVDAGDPQPRALQILVGSGWIITNHTEQVGFLAEHRERITDQREAGRLTSVEFLVSILDWHVEQFFGAAATLEAEA
jgi:Mg2+ and Co2+ transporter CorA